jgi:hypothetical protein
VNEGGSSKEERRNDCGGMTSGGGGCSQALTTHVKRGRMERERERNTQ